MPIKQMYFDGDSGRDIHVLRTQTTRSLTAPWNIALVDADDTVHAASVYLPLHPEVELHFRPVFDAVRAGTQYTGFGISVNIATGVVSFPGPFSADTPHNFLVECLVVRNDGGAEPIETLVMRVHLHTSVKAITVTPPRLTIRRLTASGADETRYRFTVRAEFDDDVVGDVTHGHGISWTPPQHFTPTGFFLIPAGIVPSATPIAVTAAPPAAWAVPPVQANVVVAQPWQADPALVNIDLVEGARSTWGATPAPAEVPNVLLLGQGFTAADIPVFEGIASGLVNAQKGDPITLPYDRLGGAMNYWRVAVPAALRGAPIRCEVYLEEAFDTAHGIFRTFALPVPRPKRREDNSPWTRENLIYAAGLPIPADAAGKRSVAEIRNHWKVLFPPPTRLQVDSIPAAIISLWQEFATRTFFEEFETLPALVRGSPPAASDPSEHTHVDPDPDRGGDAELERFLAALQASIPVTLPGGNRLGTLWAEDNTAVAFNNRRLIAHISNSRGRAHGGPFVSLPLQSRLSVAPFRRSPGSRLLTVDSDALKPAVGQELNVFRILAHELAHQFGLGDEYVEVARTSTFTEADLTAAANLTTEETVRARGRFDSRDIKWNWERIAKAAVINGPVVSLGSGVYRVPVRPPQALAFKKTDIVRIRLRLAGKPLQRSPPTWGDFTVDSIGPGGADLTITEAAPNTIALPGTGSVIYAPVPAPASAGYPYARLISPLVERYIDGNDRPLTPRVCDPKAVLAHGGEVQVPEEWPLLISTTDFLWSRRNVPLIVGLYAGGARFACGIYHPVGWCMMRNTRPAKRLEAFCPVCRYVLVDFIDPSQHGSIDRLYEEIYQG